MQVRNLYQTTDQDGNVLVEAGEIGTFVRAIVDEETGETTDLVVAFAKTTVQGEPDGFAPAE